MAPDVTLARRLSSRRTGPPAAREQRESRRGARGASTSAELITEAAQVRALLPEWRALALAASNATADPAWARAWIDHVASRLTRTRLVAVRDRGRLIGVGPFCVVPRRGGIAEYRLMGGDFGVRTEPLALSGREWDVAAWLAQALAAASPRPDIVTFGPMALRATWPAALQAHWPGHVRGVLQLHRITGEPMMILREPTFDAWLDSLGTHTRRNLRREQRLFERSGGTVRWTSRETLRGDAETFARLHRSSWQGRGRSRLVVLADRLADWLESLGRELIDDQRFRLCVLEADGAPICADLRLIAGEESAGINVGWDRRYRRLAPGKLAAVEGVRDAYRAGCRYMQLGYGEHPHKLLFANGNDPVAWSVFLVPSRRLPYTYGQLLPSHLRERGREAAQRALPASWFAALRDIRQKVRG
jgi:CelD/BcsL family acetyltransferase involved in cellulose biosynthesis